MRVKALIQLISAFIYIVLSDDGYGTIKFMIMDIIDKTIIYVLCGLMLLQHISGGKLIVVGLWVLFVALLNTYFEKKQVGFVSGIAFAISMVLEPSIAWMYPVMAYDLWDTKNYLEMGIVAVISFVFLLGNPFAYIVFELVMVLLAIILCQKTIKQEQLTHLVRKTRDDEQEKNMLLSERNHHLIEKQDQEVYVATLKERNRIAREIHDNVGHILTRTILQMGALMTVHKKDEALHGQLSLVKDNLDLAMNNVRESVHDLHDESVDLEQALKEIVEGLQGKFLYDFSYDASGQIPRNYKYAIIGIVKEAVSNIIKYSKNNQAEVIFREHPGMYQLTIRDYMNTNKKNQDVEQVQDGASKSSNETKSQVQPGKASGIGLQNIQDRVDGLKGNVTITKGEEFKIFITLPK